MSTFGEPRELGRYQLSSGEQRVLVGKRINGHVAVSDLPTHDTGRVYLVERHIESQAALTGLIAAYIADSLDRGEPAALVPRDLVDADALLD
jgi:hypothetical protein